MLDTLKTLSSVLIMTLALTSCGIKPLESPAEPSLSPDIQALEIKEKI